MSNDNSPTPTTGMHQLSPHLVCAGAADAIDFYVKAFGATELLRLPGPDGKLMHAAVSINGSSVLLVDEMLELRRQVAEDARRHTGHDPSHGRRRRRMVRARRRRRRRRWRCRSRTSSGVTATAW